jgi:hypothetical protein
MDKLSGIQSLPNPATYLYAALRAFVSNAYKSVSTLLSCPEVFNFGPGTPYPDLTTLLEKLNTAADEWKEHNLFIADLIRTTAARAARAQKAAATKDEENRIALEVFRALTNHFFCYIKVDRTQAKGASTVRVLFPVDSDCDVCPLKNSSTELCANSCFRLAFFPHKPEEMFRLQEVYKYDQHYKAAQFALADASFAAAIPDLNSGYAPELSLAALMVPLLFGEPLLLTDAEATKEQYELPAKTRTLIAHCRFGKMNKELGIRSEAFLPVKVERSFMPGFYGGLGFAGQPADTPLEEWVPDFPNSSPFCIELYSPLPDWFAHASEEGIDHSVGKHKYFFRKTESDSEDKRVVPPIPRIYSLPQEAGHGELEAVWRDIGEVLALGFNWQHYSELMANQFVAWLRTVFKNSAYDPFTRALKKRYMDYKKIQKDEDIPAEVRDFLNSLTVSADLLADVLNEIHHGMLLHSSFATAASYDLSSLKGIQALAREVNDATVVDKLSYGEVPFCDEPFEVEQVSKILKKTHSGVLSRLVAEVIRNHNNHRQSNQGRAVSFHACLDPDQNRFSLHFCSPGVHVGLTDYLNLRQGLPHLRQGVAPQSERRLSGIGLALSRVIAEEYGFEYVLGLGRGDECTPAEPDFNITVYRRDLHTRIYFGDTL